MDLLDEVITYIISNNYATKKDTDIFKDYSPKSPDDCVIVYEYKGSAVHEWEDISVRSIQIVVRAKNITNAKTLCWNIFKTLNPPGGMMLINTRKVIVSNRNTPIKIATDEFNRNLVAFNLGITTNFD